MSSTTYSTDLQDTRFVLFDQFEIDKKFATHPHFAELDREIYEATLEEGKRIAEEVLAPINRGGDRVGCKLDEDGNVTTPPGYKDAWRVFADGGWIGVSAPAEVGGGGMPFTIATAISDMTIGACTAFVMYPGLTAGAARLLLRYAGDSFGRTFAEKMFRGEWGGTMCLTESGAGSSVGDNRCKATPTDEPGVYLLEGEKIFISGGDQDLTSNIIHLVLARTPDAGTGTKGLSLFAVPKFLVNADGSLGERNGAHVLGIEHKMGINGSATCTLGLGVRGPCRGLLIGEERQGIELMFMMMNEARIGVAVQGLAMATAAYSYSLAYANERVQGTALRDLKNPDAQRVPIVQHADVRRMLMLQKVHAETMRALCVRLAVYSDLAEGASDEAERRRLEGRVDLLVPILKGLCTDLGYEMATLAVQVYGGYGYTGEFPVEQLVRDAKIMSIYEGTNGIQALDLLGRKMRIGSGALFIEWMQETESELRRHAKAGFIPQAAAISKVVQSLAATAMHLANLARTRKIDAAMVQATPFLRMFGLVLLAVEAIEQAAVAKRLIETKGSTPYLRGKLLSLDFYVTSVLPQAIALSKIIQSGDESALDPELFG
ncbi:MAG TPA: acyl-CoA dehydrogenase [Nannocystaceae bacterium]|nr:acyl-CoA dehydrogenase [Nannocystaceae bacterium]